MCSAACASSRFLPSEAYGGSFPTTPIPGCMSYWISWALITGCTHGLQVRASSERLEGRRLKKKPTDSTGQGCEMVVKVVLPTKGHPRAATAQTLSSSAFSGLPRSLRTAASRIGSSLTSQRRTSHDSYTSVTYGDIKNEY